LAIFSAVALSFKATFYKHIEPSYTHIMVLSSFNYLTVL